jgi:hypothetical protein
MRRLIAPLGLLSVLTLSACEDVTFHLVAFSTWAGSHISLTITVNGGLVEYDCAEGEILEPIRPVNGRFSVRGIHREGTGGPVGIDPIAVPRPARYEGVITDDRMNLTVTLTDRNERLGVFNLRGGAESQLVKCL